MYYIKITLNHLRLENSFLNHNYSKLGLKNLNKNITECMLEIVNFQKVTNWNIIRKWKWIVIDIKK